jgi:hypothetical protein
VKAWLILGKNPKIEIERGKKKQRRACLVLILLTPFDFLIKIIKNNNNTNM